MNSFHLRLDPASMMFFTENKEQTLLAFILTFGIEILDTPYTFECRMQYHPKTKQFLLAEYTLGEGFKYFEMTTELLSNASNKQKIKILSPESENFSGVWLTYWNQKEEHREKLMIYKSWWEENLKKIETHILDHKEEINLELQNIIDNLKIS
jgi:hypothetical protein